MRFGTRTTAALAIAATLLAATTGCTTTSAAAPAPSPTSKTVDVVVIGDSIIDPANGCGDCAGFGEQFAEHVGSVVDATPRVHLVTALSVPDALTAVTEDASARRIVAAADVVVVEVGYNNVIPDPETGIGCKGTLVSFIDWIHATRADCMEQGVQTYGDLYARIFSTVKDLTKGHSTAYIATTSIDGNNGDPSVDPQGILAVVPKADRPLALRWTIDAYTRWNSMLTQRADAAGFQVVDLATAVNGVYGTQPWLPYTVDGAHPNEDGHRLIAKQLETTDLTMLG